jgi:PHP family Zn ribbon phosphoesterase
MARLYDLAECDDCGNMYSVVAAEEYEWICPECGCDLVQATADRAHMLGCVEDGFMSRATMNLIMAGI